MRALVQRVSSAHVCVQGKVVGEIGGGLCVFLGVKQGDGVNQATKLADKVTNLRIFADHTGKMNRSLRDVGGGLLVVSQFTLYGNTRKGNRPSYSEAAEAGLARQLYEVFIDRCRRQGASVETGVFQAQMEVRLVNDGPVTLICDSE